MESKKKEIRGKKTIFLLRIDFVSFVIKDIFENEKLNLSLNSMRWKKDKVQKIIMAFKVSVLKESRSTIVIYFSDLRVIQPKIVWSWNIGLIWVDLVEFDCGSKIEIRKNA